MTVEVEEGEVPQCPIADNANDKTKKAGVVTPRHGESCCVQQNKVLRYRL